MAQLIQHRGVRDLLLGRHDVKQAAGREMDQHEIEPQLTAKISGMIWRAGE